MKPLEFTFNHEYQLYSILMAHVKSTRHYSNYSKRIYETWTYQLCCNQIIIHFILILNWRFSYTKRWSTRTLWQFYLTTSLTIDTPLCWNSVRMARSANCFQRPSVAFSRNQSVVVISARCIPPCHIFILVRLYTVIFAPTISCSTLMTESSWQTSA